jgi:hypothetical protein
MTPDKSKPIAVDQLPPLRRIDYASSLAAARSHPGTWYLVPDDDPTPKRSENAQSHVKRNYPDIEAAVRGGRLYVRAVAEK